MTHRIKGARNTRAENKISPYRKKGKIKMAKKKTRRRMPPRHKSGPKKGKFMKVKTSKRKKKR